MTDWQYHGGQGSDEEFDEELEAWVDSTVDQAMSLHYITKLEELFEGRTTVDTTEAAELVTAAAAAPIDDYSADFEDPEAESEAPLNGPETEEEQRARVRELILSRVRRPMAAPYFDAGYEAGTAQLKPDYAGEDKELGFRSKRPEHRHDPRWVTQYDDDAENVDEEGGLLIDDDDEPIDGSWGWVVDEGGDLFLFDPGECWAISPEGKYVQIVPGQAQEYLKRGFTIQSVHHSTPVAGAPVAGAGIMTLRKGKIVEISDQSGHYRPDAAQQFNAIEEMRTSGYDVSEAKVRLTGRDMKGRPTDKTGWIDEAHEANPYFPTDDVMLRPAQFEQTQGDEYQIRAKRGLGDELRARVPEAAASAEGWGTQAPTPEEVQYASPSDPVKLELNYADLDDLQPAPESSAPATRPRRDSLAEDGDPDDSSAALYDTDVTFTAEPKQDADAAYLEQARDYLERAGRSAFAEWFKTLPADTQTKLVADPQIAAAWRTPERPAQPAFQPAENDFEMAAEANSKAVDDLSDGGSAEIVVAGFLVLVGFGHVPQHRDYAAAASDRVTGRVTVRKARLGRGAGTLTVTGIPPAKQEIVRSSLARFSRKTVTFA